MAILTLAEYKIYKNITNNNSDTRLDFIIPKVEAYFIMRIKRNIEEVEHEEYYDGDGTSELILKKYPVTSITELKIGDEVLTTDEYALYSSTGIIKLKNGGAFYCGIQNIYIKYKSGYITANIPEELKIAIAQVVSRKHEEADKAGETFSSEAFLGGSLVIRESDLTGFAQDVINNYKKKGSKHT
jgi:hypothetical protein